MLTTAKQNNTMKKGFDRLRGLAAASAIGLGLMGAGSVRATSTALPIANLTRGTAAWKTIQNQSLLFSATSFSAMNNRIITDTTLPTTEVFTYLASASSISPAFAIADVSASGFTEAFDDALHLAVNGELFVNPDATVDLTGDTVTSGTQTLAGIETEIQYYFHPTRPVVRAMYSFENTSTTDISIKALVAGALTSDFTTTIQATSTANTSLDTPILDDTLDLWRVSNDQTSIGTDSSTDPAITLTRFGTGASVIPVSVLTLGKASIDTGAADNFGERYDLTIAAGETARILVFAEINKNIDEATSCAVDFASLDAAAIADMLTGLLVEELNEVVNYGALGTIAAPARTCSKDVIPTPDPDPAPPDDGDLSTGALNLASLTTLLGFLTLVRVHRNKKAV
jgi:hypothetical protein